MTLRRYLNVDGVIYRPPYEGPVDDVLDEEPVDEPDEIAREAVTARERSIDLIVSSLAIDETLAGGARSSPESLRAQAEAMLTKAQGEARAILDARAAPRSWWKFWSR